MSVVKWGVLAVALTVMGTSTARAWSDVSGSVICPVTNADPVKPLANVGLTFTQGAVSYSATTGEDGTFAFTASTGQAGTWTVTLDLTGAGGSGTVDVVLNVPEITPTIALAPIEVFVPACAPPPPPSCPELEGVVDGSVLCQKLGNPSAECAYFGLLPVGGEEGAVGVASMDADLGLVKAGTCYKVYVGVTAGEPLSSPNDKGISHVTYCGCQ